MIFLQLFWSFLKIGIFTFGGGLAMVALIQNEVTQNHQWLSAQEFTDVVAVSQMTPGPVGINTATYTGYSAVLNAGYAPWMAVGGSLLASLAVVLLPMLLMVLAVRFLQRYQDNSYVTKVLKLLRLVVIGVIAAAALQLATVESFGQPGLNSRFVVCVWVFLVVFVLSLKKKNPVVLMLGAGAVGMLFGAILNP